MTPGEENNGLTEDENKELERNYRLWSKIIFKFLKDILARIWPYRKNDVSEKIHLLSFLT